MASFWFKCVYNINSNINNKLLSKNNTLNIAHDKYKLTSYYYYNMFNAFEKWLQFMLTKKIKANYEAYDNINN